MAFFGGDMVEPRSILEAAVLKGLESQGVQTAALVTGLLKRQAELEEALWEATSRCAHPFGECRLKCKAREFCLKTGARGQGSVNK